MPSRVPGLWIEDFSLEFFPSSIETFSRKELDLSNDTFLRVAIPFYALQPSYALQIN